MYKIQRWLLFSLLFVFFLSLIQSAVIFSIVRTSFFTFFDCILLLSSAPARFALPKREAASRYENSVAEESPRSVVHDVSSGSNFKMVLDKVIKGALCAERLSTSPQAMYIVQQRWMPCAWTLQTGE